MVNKVIKKTTNIPNRYLFFSVGDIKMVASGDFTALTQKLREVLEALENMENTRKNATINNFQI